MLASSQPDLLQLPTSTRNLSLATPSSRVKQSVLRRLGLEKGEARRFGVDDQALATEALSRVVSHHDRVPEASSCLFCRWTRHKMFSSRCLFGWRWAAETHGRVTISFGCISLLRCTIRADRSRRPWETHVSDW